MTMTEMVGTLERQGWRFRVEDGEVHASPPRPRPANADAVLAEIRRRRTEAAGFLHAREEAYGAMRTFQLRSVPVFGDTPLPEARVVAFPIKLTEVEPAPARRRRS
jgi:hypothetical protein